MDGFWIAAPGAAQRAALKEHRGTNTRPILDRKSLDVEDQSLNSVSWGICQGCFNKVCSLRAMIESWVPLGRSTQKAL
jgi:hypothetical protein